MGWRGTKSGRAKRGRTEWSARPISECMLNAGCCGMLGAHFIDGDVFSGFRFERRGVWTIHEVPGDARPPHSDAALQRAQLAG